MQEAAIGQEQTTDSSKMSSIKQSITESRKIKYIVFFLLACCFVATIP